MKQFVRNSSPGKAWLEDVLRNATGSCTLSAQGEWCPLLVGSTLEETEGVAAKTVILPSLPNFTLLLRLKRNLLKVSEWQSTFFLRDLLLIEMSLLSLVLHYQCHQKQTGSFATRCVLHGTSMP